MEALEHWVVANDVCSIYRSGIYREFNLLLKISVICKRSNK